MTRRELGMVATRYTQWDGTQRLKLDADKVFEKLAEYLSYTDDVRQAMDWMMRQGMDLPQAWSAENRVRSRARSTMQARSSAITTEPEPTWAPAARSAS